MNIFIRTILFILTLTGVIYGAWDEKEAIIVESPKNHLLVRPQEIRPSILVLHYTEVSLAKTLQIFAGKTDPEIPACSHYTLSEEGILFQHAPEEVAARHAGVSYWDTHEAINLYSIGVEHVNPGYKKQDTDPEGIVVQGDEKPWYHFNEQQIEKSIALCKSILQRHTISPRNVVGHADIAPKRKLDPGPLFPWKKLADAGIGAWPNMEKSWDMPCFLHAKEQNNLHEWLIDHLHIWGYQLPNDSVCAQDIIKAFQMHFRPDIIGGIADEETAQILNALFCNYILKEPRSICFCGKN